MSPLLADLDRRTRGALAEASVMRRPLGPILTTATQAALTLEDRRLVRPSEVPRFFDALTAYTQSLANVPPSSSSKGRRRRSR